MTDQRGRPSQAAAYRARPVPPNPHQAFRIRRGPPLAAGMVPVPPPPTDSAAAPRLPRGRQKPLVSVPADPAYERKLEQLAEAMLGQAREAAAHEAAPDALAAPGAARQVSSTPSAANGGFVEEAAASGVASQVQSGGRTDTEPKRQREAGTKPERPREPAADHSPPRQRQFEHHPQPQPQREAVPEPQAVRREKHGAATGREQARGRRPVETERREPLLTPLAEEKAGLVTQREAGIASPRHNRQSAPRSGLALSIISLGLMLALGGAWWLAQGEAGRQSFMSSGSSGGMERQESSDGGDRTSAPVAGGASVTRPETSGNTTPDTASASSAPRAPSASSTDNSQARASPQPGPAAAPSPASPASAAREPQTDRPGETTRAAAPRAPEDLPPPTAETRAGQNPSKAVSAPAVGAVDTRRRPGKAASGKSAQAGPAETRKASRQTADKESRTAARGPAPQRQAKSAAALPPRDDEIDRLKSQAYGESSRDRSRRGAPPAAPKPSPVSTPSSVTPINSTAEEPRRVGMQKELARCEKLHGLFYQERCKWRLCSDQWGRNGCPSYPKNEALQ